MNREQTAVLYPCLALIAETYVVMENRQRGFLKLILQEDADKFRWLLPSVMLYCLQSELHSIQGDGSNLDFECPLNVNIVTRSINGIHFEPSPENVLYLYHQDAATNPNLCVKVPLLPGFKNQTVNLVLASISQALALPVEKENQN